MNNDQVALVKNYSIAIDAEACDTTVGVRLVSFTNPEYIGRFIVLPADDSVTTDYTRLAEYYNPEQPLEDLIKDLLPTKESRKETSDFESHEIITKSVMECLPKDFVDRMKQLNKIVISGNNITTDEDFEAHNEQILDFYTSINAVPEVEM